MTTLDRILAHGLLVVGVLACCQTCVGPARADTTSSALAVLCPGHQDLAEPVRAASRRYLHHPVTLVAVMAVESNCRMDAVGAAGEVCAMQLLGVARNGNSKRELRDPSTCIDTGARWLALREVDCGGLFLGLSGYNARTCGGGKGYARKVLAAVARFWRAMTNNEQPRS